MLASDALTDLLLGIRTGGPIRRRMPDPVARNVHYEPLRYAAMRLLLQRLPLAPDDIVCDLGCGKGRVVCWLSRQKIARAVGIDLDSRLTAIAKTNLSKLRGRKAPAEIRTEDAAYFSYEGINKIIMFNPFGEDVMREVVRRVEESIEISPREVHIVYLSPVHSHVIEESNYFSIVDQFVFKYESSEEMVNIYKAL